MEYKISDELIDYDYEIIDISKYANSNIVKSFTRMLIYKYHKLCIVNISCYATQGGKIIKNLPQNLSVNTVQNLSINDEKAISSRAYISYHDISVEIGENENINISGIYVLP